jgi:hypothetical protein
MVAGNKLKANVFLNAVLRNFYFFFSRKSELFSKKYPSYDIFYTFAKGEKKFFNFNFVLNMVFLNNNSMFYSKVIRLDKRRKYQKQTKDRYSVEYTYLDPRRRKSYLLKQINLYSNNFNFYKHKDRLFISFCNTFFLEKDSEIYKSKIKIYNYILKKNSA